MSQAHLNKIETYLRGVAASPWGGDKYVDLLRHDATRLFNLCMEKRADILAADDCNITQVLTDVVGDYALTGGWGLPTCIEFIKSQLRRELFLAVCGEPFVGAKELGAALMRCDSSLVGSVTEEDQGDIDYEMDTTSAGKARLKK